MSDDRVRLVVVTDFEKNPAYLAQITLHEGEGLEEFLQKLEAAVHSLQEVIRAKEGTVGDSASADVSETVDAH